ncbi:efflux RND transporter periplasmic adaptor subunit [Hymenobacter sp. J193]|uniref:efflux RND transporter periplasmic adaptor subunit n=1 Tax=Hymenobacter sp. J193 TaxID=2898429 RepID=UPI002150901E|nr:efflux RND transporter periplasmic adaptor subunit [Hymenobacter sp. J193]
MIKLPSLALLLSLTLAGCGADKLETAGNEPPETGAATGKEANETEPAPDLVTLSAAEQQAAGLKTGLVQERPMGSGLAVNGTLDVPPESAVSITAPLGGYVQSTELLQGTRVRKGEVLAVLRNPEFVTLQKEYLQLRSRLKFANAELARQRELYEQEVAPLKNYQRAQAEAEALQVQLSAQAAQLRIAGLPVGGAIVPTAALRAPGRGSCGP